MPLPQYGLENEDLSHFRQRAHAELHDAVIHLSWQCSKGTEVTTGPRAQPPRLGACSSSDLREKLRSADGMTWACAICQKIGVLELS